MKIQFVLSGLFLYLLVSSCYTFSGINIDPTVKTFTVNLFENNADFVEPSFAVELTEQLKDKIRNQSRLIQDDKNPDIEFSGTVVRYQITSEAPQAGATTALNRLTIQVKIDFTNHKNEEESWDKNMPARYADFEATQTYDAVKDDIIEEVSEQIIEDIFNEAFTNW